MNLSCTKENLRRGLEIVSRIASRNTTLPILGNVLLRAERGGLRLAATNLEVGVITDVRAKVAEEGAVTVQARLLSELVQLLEDDHVALVSDGRALKVTAGESETTIQGMAPEEFPIIPEVQRDLRLKIENAHLRDAIVRTSFAAAQDATRPEISGVLFVVRGTTLTLAATDSYRLAECSLTLEEAAGDRSAIVPTRALTELARILSNDGTTEAFLSEGQALFVTNGSELTTRLIEGQYPDYQQIIPTTTATEVEIEAEALTKLVKTASLFCRPGINDVTIEVRPEQHAVRCAAANSELGTHHGSTPAKVHGGANSIVFNYRYLLDGLVNAGSATVVLGITDGGSPGVLQPKGGSGYRYLIMPIRQ